MNNVRLEGLRQRLYEDGSFKELRKSIKERKFPVGVFGVSESARAYLISTLFGKEKDSIFIFTSKDMDAKNLYEDLLLYENEVYYFPAKDLVFYNIDAISGDLRWERLKVMKALQNGKKKIVVTTIDALTAKYAPYEYFRAYHFSLEKGMEIDLKEVGKRLQSSGYVRVELVEGKGEYALRGGILDVFPPDSAQPYRVELFGDEIDSIRTFHPENQRSIEQVPSFRIFQQKSSFLQRSG